MEKATAIFEALFNSKTLEKAFKIMVFIGVAYMLIECAISVIKKQ